MNDEITTRLFEITEKYECLLRAVRQSDDAGYILARAKAIQAERGQLKDSEGS
jgi:hypothetical protein